MTVQSIWAPIEEGDVAGNHLLVAARQVPFRKMDGVGKFNDLAKEIGPRTKAFDDSWDLPSPRT